MKQVAFKSKVQCMPTVYTINYGTTWTPFCGNTFESQLDINVMKDELGIKE